MAAVLSSVDKKHVAPGTPPPIAPKPATIRVLAGRPGDKGPRHRVVVAVGADEHDVTGVLTASLAHALWQLRGGADIANWIDGETLLDQILTLSPSEGSPPEVVVPSKRPVPRR